MKICFDDNSFIQIDETKTANKIATISMCGLNDDNKSLTMSSSELSIEQAKEISDFLQNILKKFS